MLKTTTAITTTTTIVCSYCILALLGSIVEIKQYQVVMRQQ